MKEQMYLLEQFDDIKILRYDVPAFEGLSLREKLFVYYLSRAALAGRDILWDQNNFLLMEYIIIIRWKSLPLRLLLNILSHFFGKWERNSCTRK